MTNKQQYEFCSSIWNGQAELKWCENWIIESMVEEAWNWLRIAASERPAADSLEVSFDITESAKDYLGLLEDLKKDATLDVVIRFFEKGLKEAFEDVDIEVQIKPEVDEDDCIRLIAVFVMRR